MDGGFRQPNRFRNLPDSLLFVVKLNDQLRFLEPRILLRGLSEQVFWCGGKEGLELYLKFRKCIEDFSERAICVEIYQIIRWHGSAMTEENAADFTTCDCPNQISRRLAQLSEAECWEIRVITLNPRCEVRPASIEILASISPQRLL